MMHTCEYCLSDHNSWSAYIACIEQCEIEDARQQAWVRSHPTGAVRREVYST